MSQTKSRLQKHIHAILEDPEEYASKIPINTLVRLLQKLSHHYYNTEEELVPDYIYDILRDVLEERDPKNPFLQIVGAPIIDDKVRLPHFMPSLDKVKPDDKNDKLQKWLNNGYDGPYVISDKLDGVSGLYVKLKNSEKLYTRGDGKEGQDISFLIPFVIPRTIKKEKMPIGTAIRGELIISKKNFIQLGEFKNARNAVAGLVNSRENYSKKVAELTDFIGYSLMKPLYSQPKQMKVLKSWDFPLVVHSIKSSINYEILGDLFEKRRKCGIYEVDGIVVIDGSRSYKQTLKNPPYGFAFKKKLADQMTTATVVDVEWKVSKDGYYKPRIRIKPVKLVGVTVTYATAFNAKFIVDHKIGRGAQIKIIRSGDVIPYIMEVLHPAKQADLPKEPYKWNKTKVDFIVKDIHGQASDNIKTQQLTYFFRTMQVKYISEGIVKKLVDNGYNTVTKIIKASLEDLIKIDGIGEKLMTKIHTNIMNAFKETTLSRLMAASTIFGRGFGVRRTTAITDVYPKIMTSKWSPRQIKEKVMEIEGFNKITATQFAKNFKTFTIFFNKLDRLVGLNHLKEAKKADTGIIFKDEKVVFTGFRDKSLEEFIVKNGGKMSTGVSKNTTLVVYVRDENKPLTGKLKKAHDLGIKMLSREIFIKKFIKN